MEEIPESVRLYMAAIGRKGGASGKGTEWRRAACQHAAQVRWRVYAEKKRKQAEAKESEPVETPLDSEAAVHDIPAQ